jgi:hypothetical protein
MDSGESNPGRPVEDQSITPPAGFVSSGAHLRSSSDKSLLDLAWAEWETLQKKIDNVSTFPFTVKTWTVAVAAAFLGLGKGFEFPPIALYAACVIPILFWAIESKHHRVRGILSKRSGQLEALLDTLAPFGSQDVVKTDLSLKRSIGRIPGVALAFHRAKRDLARQFVALERPADVTRRKWVLRNVNLIWQQNVVGHADGIFYISVFILVTFMAWGFATRSPLKMPPPRMPHDCCCPAGPAVSTNTQNASITATPSPVPTAAPPSSLPVDPNGVALPNNIDGQSDSKQAPTSSPPPQ